MSKAPINKLEILMTRGYLINTPGILLGETMTNVRYKNGNFRRKMRARFKAMDAPCGICNGKLGPIDYNAPVDSKHPLSFVIDEIKPVSRWKEFGYATKEQAVLDINNLQAAHYACNQAKSNRVPTDRRVLHISRAVASDGAW